MQPRISNLSLRRKLLTWLLAPLCALLVFATILTYATSVRFSNQAHDRALQEIAREVFLHVRHADGRPILEMSASTESILMVDQDDRLYYQVLSKDGNVVGGNAAIPRPSGNLFQSIAPGQKIFHDAVIGGEAVRVVVANMMFKEGASATSVLVQVAETLNKRQRLATDILISVVIPQVLLIVLATLVVYYGVRQGLLPLQRLRSGVASRSHLDLSPIDVGRVPSEVRPLVDAVNDLLRRLSTTLDFQARFIADAAHHLKTPVAGIKAQIDLALREPQHEPQHADLRPAVVRMQASVVRLSRLVGQLLSLARNEPSAVESVALSMMDLHGLALEVTMEWVPKALECNVDLGFEAVPVPVFIDGDADRLRELINNLVDNAVRYTRDNGRVTVRVVDGAKKTLSVSDDGPKIPLEERRRIFERFHRLLGTHTEGSGLGLAIVSEIAALHNAAIVLEDDADGTGNTFTLFFPAPHSIVDAESLV